MANKQITINQWEKTKLEPTTTFKLQGNDDDPDVIVKRTLSLSEMWDAVNEIVEMCMPTLNIGTDDAPQMETVFMPENRDFAVRRIVISKYANFKLPQDFAKQYDLLYNTTAYRDVMNHVDQSQLIEIVNSADRKLEQKKEEKLSIAKTINDVIGQFADTANQLKDIDPDAIQQVINLLSDTENAGAKIVENAMIEAAQAQPVKKSKRAPANNIVELPNG